MEGVIYRYYVPRDPSQTKPLQTASPAAAAHRKKSVDGSQHAQNHRPSRRHSRRHKHKDNDNDSTDKDSVASGVDGLHPLERWNSYGMDATRTQSGSISSGSARSQSLKDELVNLLANPFELRHGRRYLRDLSYPLPCDLAETQRQNMRTLLGMTVFGKAACAPIVSKNVPKKVLELGCGASYWSSTCHDWFTSLGHPDVSFTGIDLAPLTPDLGKEGMDWTFVQHDIRRYPWPFEDEEFDLIMVKDMSLAVQIGVETQQFMDETIRILAEEGTLEFWESDHVLRCLRPHPPAPPKTLKPQEETALATRTYLISPGTPFAPAQNKYVADYNTWITRAFDELKLPPAPCARLLNMMYQEADTLTDIGFRRVAVPFGELRWEKETVEERRHGRVMSEGTLLSAPITPTMSSIFRGKGRAGEGISILTPDQAALRHMALLTVLQEIESLEPLLKDVSGKNSEEWSRWWGCMMASLLDDSGTSGEVLEVGAWWATKRKDSGTG